MCDESSKDNQRESSQPILKNRRHYPDPQKDSAYDDLGSVLEWGCVLRLLIRIQPDSLLWRVVVPVIIHTRSLPTRL